MATIELEVTNDQARKLLGSRIERKEKKAYIRAKEDGCSKDEPKKLAHNNGAAAKRRPRRGGANGRTTG